MSQKLTGKVALSRALPISLIARHLLMKAPQSWSILFATRADRVVKEITGGSGRAVAVQANLAKEADIRRLFAEAKKLSWPADIPSNAGSTSSRRSRV
jgi:NAD(P)-dependent dehydrogenase (short-subunit alcohol dehydrogenase family)